MVGDGHDPGLDGAIIGSAATTRPQWGRADPSRGRGPETTMLHASASAPGGASPTPKMPAARLAGRLGGP